MDSENKTQKVNYKLMLRKRKQMNRIYPGLLHCFAVRR